MAFNIGLDPTTDVFYRTTKLFNNLYNMFRACDCSQVEINPLVQTTTGEILVCDAKLNFDDNAEFRQKDVFSKRDLT
jgi:succinyl-CoA synthetase beta subunit